MSQNIACVSRATIAHSIPMSIYAEKIIDALGGTTELARAMEAPVTTVHAWRTIGIPTSRLAHIRLIAKDKRVQLPADDATERQAA